MRGSTNSPLVKVTMASIDEINRQLPYSSIASRIQVLKVENEESGHCKDVTLNKAPAKNFLRYTKPVNRPLVATPKRNHFNKHGFRYELHESKTFAQQERVVGAKSRRPDVCQGPQQ